MDIPTIVIFGATGDLTHKKLMPALFEIYKGHTDIHIVGFARRDISQDQFKETFTPPQKADGWDTFLTSISYHKGNFDDLQDFISLKESLKTHNVIYYLAVEPEYFTIITQKIQESGLNFQQSRILVEKPFGENKEDAISLYSEVIKVFQNNQIYILDHYVGKETVQNILAFRFANGLFESLWSKEYIDSIQITLAEDIGILTRGQYYDNAGALKDVLQNHILQMIASITMESPRSFDPKDIRDSRTALLSQLKRYSSSDDDYLHHYFALGQYEGYLSEDKVAPGSKTETFVSLKTNIENERWSGVPIYIRAGKNLPIRVAEIYIQFKKSLQHLFNAEDANYPSNILGFRLQPNEGISLKLLLKEPGHEMKLKEVSMDFCYADDFKITDNSYIRLLEDAIVNDQSLFISIDEIIASWEFTEPLLTYAHEHPDRLETYPQKTWGPEHATSFIHDDGREWLSMYPYKCDINLNVK